MPGGPKRITHTWIFFMRRILVILKWIKVWLMAERLKYFFILFLYFLSNVNICKIEFMKIPLLRSIRKGIRSLLTQISMQIHFLPARLTKQFTKVSNRIRYSFYKRCHSLLRRLFMILIEGFGFFVHFNVAYFLQIKFCQYFQCYEKLNKNHKDTSDFWVLTKLWLNLIIQLFSA